MPGNAQKGAGFSKMMKWEWASPTVHPPELLVSTLRLLRYERQGILEDSPEEISCRGEHWSLDFVTNTINSVHIFKMLKFLYLQTCHLIVPWDCGIHDHTTSKELIWISPHGAEEGTIRRPLNSLTPLPESSTHVPYWTSHRKTEGERGDVKGFYLPHLQGVPWAVKDRALWSSWAVSHTQC